MSDELNNIDDIFRSAIEPMKEQPSGEVWAKLDAGLDKVKADTIKKKYDSLKRIVMVLSFALLCSLIYIISRNEKSFFQQTLYTHGSTSSSQQHQRENHINQVTRSTSSESNKPDVAEDKNRSSISKPASKMPTVSTVSTANYSVPSTMKTAPIQVDAVKQTVNSSAIQNNVADDLDLKDATSSSLSNHKKKMRSIKQKVSVIITGKAVIDSIAEVETENQRKRFVVNNLEWNAAKEYQVINRSNPNIKPKDKQTASRKLPVSITGFFSPVITTEALKRESNTSHSAFDEIREGEFEHFSFNLGALATVPLNKKWSLESGLLFTSKNSNMKPRKVYAVQTHNGDIKYKYECSAGYWYMDPKYGSQPEVGDSMYASESIMNLKYFTIPVMIKYEFLTKNRLSLFASAGLAINLMQKGSISSEVEDGGMYEEYYTSEKIYGLRKSFVSSIFSIEGNYKFNNRLSLYFSPTFNWALSPITKNTSVKTFINTISFSTGLKFNMK